MKNKKAILGAMGLYGMAAMLASNSVGGTNRHKYNGSSTGYYYFIRDGNIEGDSKVPFGYIEKHLNNYKPKKK